MSNHPSHYSRKRVLTYAKMYDIVKLITLFCIQNVAPMSMQKPYFMDKSGPENEITEFIYSKGYLPNENKLQKPAVIKSVDDDVTYLLSKLSDRELVKLLNDQPKKKSYDLDDIVKITLGDKSKKDRKLSVLGQDIQDEEDVPNLNIANDKYRIGSGVENDQQAYYKLNHKPILPKEQNNQVNFQALKKLHDLLNYRSEHDDENLTEEKKELLFEILVSQLKTLCCKSNIQPSVQNHQVNTFASNILSNFPKENSYLTEFKTSKIQKPNEFMFLIVNDEIKSKSNDDLILVDPETLEKNSSVLLLGPIITPLSDGQLKVVMDRISSELSKPDYVPLLQQLSEGTLSDNNIILMKNVIFGHEARRYIKPHRFFLFCGSFHGDGAAASCAPNLSENQFEFSLLTMAEQRERTFIMVKPDGVQRGLVGEILQRFEKKGFKLVALKFVWPSEELLQKHYSDLSSRPFFPGLVKYMSSGPVVPMVWEGLNVVKTGRQMLGATNPADSQPGTIRGDLCIHVGRNIIHGSDSVESANKEIALWFTEKEVVGWTPAAENWVYE